MIYVGIDVAKDKHDCFITNSEGEVLFQAQPPLQVVVWVGPHKGRLHARPKGRVSQALLLVRL